MHFRIIVFAVLFLLHSSVLVAATISSQYGIGVQLLDYDTGNYYVDFSERTYSEVSYDTAKVYGDLSTGKVGSLANGEYVQSIVSVFDTVTFSIDGANYTDVSFCASYDGVFSPATDGYAYSNPSALYNLIIYDVTDVDEWIEIGGMFDSASPVDDLTSVYQGKLELTLNDSGSNASDTLSGSFTAESGHTYGIYIYSDTCASHGALADFYNTGTFNFADISGTTFTSGSGVFLSESDSVPLPSTILFLGSGLIGLLARTTFCRFYLRRK